MHRYYFPPCTVSGPIEPPVPFKHLGTRGCIPHKCASCSHSFEGGCTRFVEGERYMHLDYGPCGIEGPTDPVTYENSFIRAKVEIPRKCARCVFLMVDSIYGFTCQKDEEKWGECRRGLDWGVWSPDSIYLQLPRPKITTKDLVNAAYANDFVLFAKEYRKVNPNRSLEEARSDFDCFRGLITANAEGTKRTEASSSEGSSPN